MPRRYPLASYLTSGLYEYVPRVLAVVVSAVSKTYTRFQRPLQLAMRTTLRDQLFDIRIKNAEGKYFIPNKVLEDVLSADKIRTCILYSSIEEIRRADVLRVIENGGKRVFAILLLLGKEYLMANFVQNDHMLQGTNLDSKLPLRVEPLGTMLLDARVASEFCQRQCVVA